MRIGVSFSLLLLLALSACGGGRSETGTGSGTYKDLADARAAIPCQLTRNGPAPQEWEQTAPGLDAQHVSFKSGELTLNGWLGLPEQGSGPFPAVVYIHGGFAFDGSEFDQLERWLDEGWAVFTPIVRAENGNPGHYDLLYHEIDDIIAAGKYLTARKEIDAKRICVMGHSVGGTRCILAAMLDSPFAASASIGGATDVQGWLAGQEELAPFNHRDNDQMFVRSPKFHIRSLRIPLILARGAQESWNEDMTRAFVDEAKKLGKDVTTFEVPGDHFSCWDAADGEIRQRFNKIISK